MYTEEQLEKMRFALAVHEANSIDDSTLFDILKEGCPGYDNLPDSEIIELYEEHIGEEV
jgi:hypothetical protein